MKITMGVITLLLIALVYFLFSAGFFANVTIEEKNVGPYTLVYEEFIGDYKNTPKIQDKIYYALLNDYKIETLKGFGIYYDNPKEVSRDKLRSEIGCILEEKDLARVEELKTKSFKIKEFPKTNAIVIEFPFNNQFSILAGIMKVYPKLEAYRKEKNYKPREVMEIYDVPSKKILYISLKNE